MRGPIHPITAITISMAAAMNANTPVVPKLFRTPAIRNEVKIAEKRLQEWSEAYRARADAGRKKLGLVRMKAVRHDVACQRQAYSHGDEEPPIAKAG